MCKPHLLLTSSFERFVGIGSDLIFFENLLGKGFHILSTSLERLVATVFFDSEKEGLTKCYEYAFSKNFIAVIVVIEKEEELSFEHVELFVFKIGKSSIDLHARTTLKNEFYMISFDDDENIILAEIKYGTGVDAELALSVSSSIVKTSTPPLTQEKLISTKLDVFAEHEEVMYFTQFLEGSIIGFGEVADFEDNDDYFREENLLLYDLKTGTIIKRHLLTSIADDPEYVERPRLPDNWATPLENPVFVINDGNIYYIAKDASGYGLYRSDITSSDQNEVKMIAIDTALENDCIFVRKVGDSILLVETVLKPIVAFKIQGGDQFRRFDFSSFSKLSEDIIFIENNEGIEVAWFTYDHSIDFVFNKKTISGWCAKGFVFFDWNEWLMRRTNQGIQIAYQSEPRKDTVLYVASVDFEKHAFYSDEELNPSGCVTPLTNGINSIEDLPDFIFDIKRKILLFESA